MTTPREIILARHGRPTLRRSGFQRGADFADFLEAYDRAGIDLTLKPPALLVEITLAAGFLVCSDLPRAAESARAADPRCRAIADSRYREVTLPAIGFGALPLPTAGWMALSRTMWFAGLAHGSETPGEASARASAAAARLAELTLIHGSVLLFGHGMINWFIARSLRADGWVGPMIPSTGYWSWARYRPGLAVQYVEQGA